MSDGQPKKRKDKRKKKDEYQEEVFGNLNDPADEIIHVHKDAGIGGNFCTKIIFFVLLLALGLVLGLSFLKYNDPAEGNIEAAEPSPLAVSIEELLFRIPFVEDVLKAFNENVESEEKKEDDLDEEELFPEAAEALRLEREALNKENIKSKPPIEEPEEKSNSLFEEWFEEEPEETKTDGIAHSQPTTEKSEVQEPEIVPVASAPAPPTSAPPSVPEPPKPEYISPSAVQDILNRYGEEDEYSEGGEEEEDNLIEEPISDTRYQHLMADYYKGGDEGSDIESDPELPDNEYAGKKGEESGNEVETGSEVENTDEEEEEEEEEDDEPIVVQRQLWASSLKKGEPLTESEGEDEEEEEEEEESDDEPPVARPKQPTGGARALPEEEYPYSEITNEEDWYIREQLDHAEEEFQYRSLDKALSLFESLMSRHPNSSRARYGKARVLDKIADQKRSNAFLDAAIEAYLYTLKAPNVPDPLLVLVAERAINQMRFKGLHLKAVPVHELLIKTFNSTPKYHVSYAITYLMINRLKNAESVLKHALNLFPEDPPILAYYGLVLKLLGRTSECVKPFEKGLASDHGETRDSRLYFHLGDALSRIGRNEDAMKVYEKAVQLGLIRSKYQRSLYNVDHLKAKPWWTAEETTYLEYFKKLEDNWKKIRDEGMAALKISGSYLDEAESLRDVGDWKQFEIFARGIQNKNNCIKVPFTCSLISEFVAAKTCKRGQVKFSVMEPGTHVWPHCGPTNCRLRAHLGLVVPPGPYIRVAESTRTWVEGKVIIFDDSFEHEVWHNGTSFRLVLIVDVWHPDLSEQEKRSLSPI